MTTIRKIRESDIQDKLEKELGGKHAYCASGIVDILTAGELIEIKNWNNWKAAIGQLQAYHVHFPDRKLRVHFFGKIPKIEKQVNIVSTFSSLKIAVTWEFEDIKKCEFVNKEKKCDKIIRHEYRFCIKCQKRSSVRNFLSAQKNCIKTPQAVTEKTDLRTSNICLSLITASHNEMINNIPDKDKIFQKSSHSALISLPSHIKNMIEILCLSPEPANELSILWCNSINFTGSVNSNINKEEWIVIITGLRRDIFSMLIIFMSNMQSYSFSDINLYIQVTEMIRKLLKNISRQIEMKTIDLCLKKMMNTDVEIP